MWLRQCFNSHGRCLELTLLLVLLPTIASAQEAISPQPGSSPFLDAVPDGYLLHAYDDCGIPERQPHVDMTDSYCWTFNTSDTDADLKSRSAVFSYKSINLRYAELDPELSYVLAVTYASDHVYKRVQSLWANGVQLHEPYALPNAKAVRLIVKVPASVVQSGEMALQLRIHGEVNATVSIVELWANAPPKQDALRLSCVSGLVSELAGRVLDLAYEPVAGATVRLGRPGQSTPLANTQTQPDGWFRFPRNVFENGQPTTDLEVVVNHEGHIGHAHGAGCGVDVRSGPLSAHSQPRGGPGRPTPVARRNLAHRPLHPPRVCVLGLSRMQLGRTITFPASGDSRDSTLPQEQTVAVARDVCCAARMGGAIACSSALMRSTLEPTTGSTVSLLGYSENLFTPVEWEITSLVRPGKPNRLDLAMKVDTVSEKLSYSSGYAFHNLGGIDRSVSIFALPPVHVTSAACLPHSSTKRIAMRN